MIKKIVTTLVVCCIMVGCVSMMGFAASSTHTSSASLKYGTAVGDWTRREYPDSYGGFADIGVRGNIVYNYYYQPSRTHTARLYNGYSWVESRASAGQWANCELYDTGHAEWYWEW